MKRTFCVTICALCVFAAPGRLAASAARGNVLHGIGALGGGGASSGPTEFPALLQDHRGLNFGGAGVPYAYGHVGADSQSVLLPGNQVDQVVAQVTAGNITLATISIGGNDYIDAANNIIAGTLEGASLLAFQQQVKANIESAVAAVQGAGASVVLGGFSNLVHLPAGESVKADPVARALLENAVAGGNALQADFAYSQGIPFINFFDLLSAVYDAGTLQVGGVDLILTGYDESDPHYFWEDEFHPGIVVNGVIANLYLQAINEGCGTAIPLLSDEEILALAGLEGEYVEETFAAAYPYTAFVTVPEPPALVLAATGLAMVMAVGALRVNAPLAGRCSGAYNNSEG